MKKLILLLAATSFVLVGYAQPKPSKIEKYLFDTLAQEFYTIPRATEYYEYDQHGDKVVTVTDYDDGDSYRHTQKRINGFVNETISEKRDGIYQPWVPYLKSTIELNSLGYYDEALSYSWDMSLGDWKKSSGSRWSYSYDSLGRITKISEEGYFHWVSDWYKDSESIFTYEGSDSLPDLIATYPFQNDIKQAGTRLLCRDWTDTFNGRLYPGPSVFYTQVEENGTWKYTAYDSSIVDASINDHYNYTYDSVSGNFKVYSHQIWGYEMNGFSDEYLFVRWNGSQYDTLSIEKEVFKYGSQNEPLESIRHVRYPNRATSTFEKSIYYYTKLSVQNLANESITIYPNPIQSGSLLKGNLEQGDEYRIVDMQGKVRKQGQMSGNGIECSIPAGLYTLHIIRGQTNFFQSLQVLP